MRKRKINGIEINTGIITNWGNKINNILQELNIRDCFDIVLNTDIVPNAKPSPIIFNHACLLAQVELENAIHIGDSLHDDALGAEQAGMHGIWIKRNDYLHPDASLLRHPVFTNLEEVLIYIENEIII